MSYLGGAWIYVCILPLLLQKNFLALKVAVPVVHVDLELIDTDIIRSTILRQYLPKQAAANISLSILSLMHINLILLNHNFLGSNLSLGIKRLAFNIKVAFFINQVDIDSICLLFGMVLLFRHLFLLNAVLGGANLTFKNVMLAGVTAFNPLLTMINWVGCLPTLIDLLKLFMV